MRAVTRHYNRETFSELFKLAVPMVVSQGTFAVMIFTDRLFMSRIDPTHMAAALGGGVALFFSFCFFRVFLAMPMRFPRSTSARVNGLSARRS